MQHKINYIKDILKNNGHKVTKTRLQIIKMFLDNADKHFSAKELYFMLKDNDSSIGITTVYRNLKLLKDSQIIEEIINKDEKLYELKLFGKKSLHGHFICIECGKVTDYKDIDMSLKIFTLIDRINKKYNFEVKDIDILSSCICDECKNKQKTNNN